MRIPADSSASHLHMLAAGNARQTQDAPTQHLVQEPRLMRLPTCTKCVENDLLFEEWGKAEQGWFLDPNRLETVHKGDGHVFIVGRKGVRVRVIVLLFKVVRFETSTWAKGWSKHTFYFLFAQIGKEQKRKWWGSMPSNVKHQNMNLDYYTFPPF